MGQPKTPWPALDTQAQADSGCRKSGVLRTGGDSPWRKLEYQPSGGGGAEGGEEVQGFLQRYSCMKGLVIQLARLCAVILPPISRLWAGPQILLLPHCPGREAPATDTTITTITPPLPAHTTPAHPISKVETEGKSQRWLFPEHPIWELCHSRSRK